MIIISKTVLVDFGRKNTSAIEALNAWYKKCKLADWKNLNELKISFSSADYVGNDRFVFNIKGNHFRIVAMIFFDIRTIFIRFVGTHAEYDQINCKTI